MSDAARHQGEDGVIDATSGTVYHRYDSSCLFDPVTDAYYVPLPDGEDYEGVAQIAGKPNLPNRRYRTMQGLRAELEAEASGYFPNRWVRGERFM